MSSALDGLVVIDLATEFWSSLGVAMLGDFGADVIRVETRRTPLAPAPDPEERAAWSYREELANRNKRSVALDLGQREGGEILRELVGRADVLVCDWPTNEAHAAGLDYDSLARTNPGLIYLRASGFGPNGPDRELPALDELAAARTGMMPILPQPGEPPVYTGSGQIYTTVMLAFGVLAALEHRERSCEGQLVDVSLFAGNMYGAALDLQAYLAMGGERLLQPVARRDSGNPMSGSGMLYATRDGRWLTLTMPDTDRWWPGLAAAVGIDPADPRFDSHEKRCEQNRLELIDRLEQAFLRHDGEHWRRVFAERQLSADVIEDYEFPAGDAQAELNRYVLSLDHPSLGRVQTLGFPIFMSETPAVLERLAPCAGQHGAQILRERLGYTEERIHALAERGILG
ncbi:MAG: CoA transferase [Deltaproteobacteria bacterium]|nr:CoA transferase [Deltaproteobacteria bacterium]